MNVFIGLALVIIFVLASVAIYYCYLWQMRKREISAHNKKELDLIKEKQLKAIKSIDLIARALLQDQVSSTEASIRIAHLSRVLVLDQSQSETFNVFHKLADESAHIPILDKWKALSRKEQREFDLFRLGLEEKYKDFTRGSAEKIVEEQFFRV